MIRTQQSGAIPAKYNRDSVLVHVVFDLASDLKVKSRILYKRRSNGRTFNKRPHEDNNMYSVPEPLFLFLGESILLLTLLHVEFVGNSAEKRFTNPKGCTKKRLARIFHNKLSVEITRAKVSMNVFRLCLKPRESLDPFEDMKAGQQSWCIRSDNASHPDEPWPTKATLFPLRSMLRSYLAVCIKVPLNLSRPRILGHFQLQMNCQPGRPFRK
jgi:hypothetical protein